jgi:predicted short-subunit dehydrogenase-like oxidoreductase (DUF2520 family)
MKVSIIGAGRVGQALARRASAVGFDIIDVVCRSRRAARKAADFIGAGVAHAAASAQLEPAELFLISTPDDKIGAGVELLQRSTVTGAIALHTSGALSSEVLRPLAEQGFAVASCHPLQSFESPERAIRGLDKTHFCIEGDAKAVRAARRFVTAIGAHHFEIRTEMKSLYHAAAVMSSGGVTALLNVTLELLARCGLSERKARDVLLPLVEGTLANIRAVGAARALTGPVRRGDAGTVERHREAIAALDTAAGGGDATAWELYRLLAERSLPLAGRAGTDPVALRRIKRVLATKPGSKE